MPITPGTEQVLHAASTWRDRCLLRDGGMLSDEPLWTITNLSQLERFFINDPREGPGTFLGKLRDQLAPSDAKAKRLAAELIWVMMLFPSKKSIRVENKASQIREIWSWGGSSLPDNHALLSSPVLDGIGRSGRGFDSYRWAELKFFIRFLLRYKQESASRREELLSNPWEFANYLDRTPDADHRQLRHMLIHLLFPEHFDRIASSGQRKTIVNSFSELIAPVDASTYGDGSTVVLTDRKLAAIRDALSEQTGKRLIDFYDPEIKFRWADNQDDAAPDGDQSLASAIETVLARYADARNAPFSGTHPIKEPFRQIEARLKQMEPITSRSNLRVNASVGQGNWARIPWISILDTRETISTQRGVYCVFLFSQDMSGVYLTLNQGVTDMIDQLGRARGRDALRSKAESIRAKIPSLTAQGFNLDNRIDLHATHGLGSAYEASTIAYKFYPAGNVPSDENIEDDLEAVLHAYDIYVDTRNAENSEGSSRAWIFQANPNFFDLRGALDSLERITWTARQHATEMAVGDIVYLWESGRDGGLIATAHIDSAPRPRQIGIEERPFVRVAERFDGDQLRVSVSIDRVLERPVTRADLLEVPGLRGMTLFRAPQGTNFRLTTSEAETLAKLLTDTDVPPAVTPVKDLAAIHASFANSLAESNISFGQRHDEVTRTLVVSLATKRFVMLTGLSGSGKTQLALRFGEWCGEDSVKLVPVRPDWTGAEALFGYEDALLPAVQGRRAWHVPEALEFMLEAAGDPARPYVLILDEMNLAHVERYFADVLSGMESRVPCLPDLQLEDGLWYPRSDGRPMIPVPENLFIVGTVNVDETTHMFSPKVLDRANTIEFRVSTDELQSSAGRPMPCESAPEELSRGFLAIAIDDALESESSESLQAFENSLRLLHEILSKEGFEFGHRVFFEARRFATLYYASGRQKWQEALDLQVLQKVLPRLHGSRRRLEPVLNAIATFCIDPTHIPSAVEGSADIFPDELAPALPRSFRKLHRMTRVLRANQFVSFHE